MKLKVVLNVFTSLNMRNRGINIFPTSIGYLVLHKKHLSYYLARTVSTTYYSTHIP
jgi:hypothetical protein